MKDLTDKTNRKVSVNLKTLFQYHEKANYNKLKKIDAWHAQLRKEMEKDAIEFADRYDIAAELHYHRITPKMLVDGFLGAAE